MTTKTRSELERETGIPCLEYEEGEGYGGGLNCEYCDASVEGDCDECVLNGGTKDPRTWQEYTPTNPENAK